MSMGTSPSQEIMQRKMNENIEELQGANVIIDDFLKVGEGDTEEEIEESQNKNLKALLQICRERNI